MNSCSIGLKRGDMVRVLYHAFKGFEWTIGQVGSILCQCHERDFDTLHNRRNRPPLKPGWWVVAVDSKTAKGGFALAGLPGEYLAPHACTSKCKPHLGRSWTG